LRTAPQLENIPLWGKNILRRWGANEHFWEGGSKYTRYNKINNNLKNFREGQDCCQERLSLFSCGPGCEPWFTPDAEARRYKL